MREVGLLARQRIYTRTVSGIDMRGKSFQAYSRSYRDQKLKAVGKASPVNLQLSGAMLNAMAIIELTPTSVTLGFTR
jgi:hypothetical protein